jgi:hypothetical protein
VTGPFWVDGAYVYATDDGLVLPNQTLLRGSRIEGFGTAIRLDRGSMGIGFTGVPERS